MKNSPLVSVIIPCYNYGKYLAGSIESAINQTYKNIEITIIDDGSTDNTGAIGKKYAKNYANVKYLRQSNRGIIETRNLCLKEAQGKYLIMLDADDYLDPNYIEETVKIAEKKGSEIVYTNVKSFGLEKKTTNFPQFDLEELKNHNYIHISSLLRTKKLKNYVFDKNLEKKTHEDWDFFLGACLAGVSAELCGSTFLNYRIHGEGRNNRAETREMRVTYVEVYLYIIDKYEKLYKEKMSYLQTKVFGAWYLALYENLDNHMVALKDMEKERNRLINEKRQILGSKTYKLSNKIAKVYRFLTFKK